jgi:hypothetical protein
MEGLVRLVADSLARNGFEAPLDHRRLRWSRWFRCESSFNLLLIPSDPGLFALGEEVIAPGEIPATGGRRMLAVFQISEAKDLGLAMGRQFAPNSPVRERLPEGRCFARYVVIEDDVQRRAAHAAMQKWLGSSAESATGISGDFVMLPESAQETPAELSESTNCRPESN